eukprot:8837588-Pyramimonas_sp.AAC.2
MKGLQESVVSFSGQIPGTSARSVMDMMMLTQSVGVCVKNGMVERLSSTGQSRVCSRVVASFSLRPYPPNLRLSWDPFCMFRLEMTTAVQRHDKGRRRSAQIKHHFHPGHHGRHRQAALW